MACKKSGQDYFKQWCMDCKRKSAEPKLHGDKNGGTFECHDLTCPAQRHVNGIYLDAKAIKTYVVGGETGKNNVVKLVKRSGI
jgi:hypothetical protein